mmetsp:Transcript_67997/g.183646  ORF Transcript_67997/g.183646 Transcript_67997/m.183646 type:complete len:361 (+) Transcript_67997:352-1434(+)
MAWWREGAGGGGRGVGAAGAWPSAAAPAVLPAAAERGLSRRAGLLRQARAAGGEGPLPRQVRGQPRGLLPGHPASQHLRRGAAPVHLRGPLHDDPGPPEGVYHASSPEAGGESLRRARAEGLSGALRRSRPTPGEPRGHRHDRQPVRTALAGLAPGGLPLGAERGAGGGAGAVRQEGAAGDLHPPLHSLHRALAVAYCQGVRQSGCDDLEQHQVLPGGRRPTEEVVSNVHSLYAHRGARLQQAPRRAGCRGPGYRHCCDRERALCGTAGDRHLHLPHLYAVEPHQDGEQHAFQRCLRVHRALHEGEVPHLRPHRLLRGHHPLGQWARSARRVRPPGLPGQLPARHRLPRCRGAAVHPGHH